MEHRHALHDADADRRAEECNGCVVIAPDARSRSARRAARGSHHGSTPCGAAVCLGHVAVDDDLRSPSAAMSTTLRRNHRSGAGSPTVRRSACPSPPRDRPSGDDPGSIEYSAVTQPLPLPFIHRWMSSSTPFAVHSTSGADEGHEHAARGHLRVVTLQPRSAASQSRDQWPSNRVTCSTSPLAPARARATAGRDPWSTRVALLHREVVLANDNRLPVASVQQPQPAQLGGWLMDERGLSLSALNMSVHVGPHHVTDHVWCRWSRWSPSTSVSMLGVLDLRAEDAR